MLVHRAALAFDVAVAVACLVLLGWVLRTEYRTLPREARARVASVEASQRQVVAQQKALCDSWSLLIEFIGAAEALRIEHGADYASPEYLAERARLVDLYQRDLRMIGSCEGR